MFSTCFVKVSHCNLITEHHRNVLPWPTSRMCWSVFWCIGGSAPVAFTNSTTKSLVYSYEMVEYEYTIHIWKFGQLRYFTMGGRKDGRVMDHRFLPFLTYGICWPRICHSFSYALFIFSFSFFIFKVEDWKGNQPHRWRKRLFVLTLMLMTAVNYGSRPTTVR